MKNQLRKSQYQVFQMFCGSLVSKSGSLPFPTSDTLAPTQVSPANNNHDPPSSLRPNKVSTPGSDSSVTPRMQHQEEDIPDVPDRGSNVESPTKIMMLTRHNAGKARDKKQFLRDCLKTFSVTLVY
ncbi:hypothetical protein Bca52824_024425 [Brassica carinata]|uniref:Uncharacterized protein n=1 Tax=Brassica carinata TaxID=52824 RepID=A0A8X7VKM2_BRACI|nr:hypothetical protein Bca52824_024425 [Brassica carinata]